MKAISRILVLGAALTMALAGAAGAKEKIVVGELNWSGAIAIQSVI